VGAASLSGLILIADLCRSSRTRFWVVGGRGTATARSSSRRRRLGPIFRVPSTGAEPSAVTRLTPPQSGHRFPQFLPDGRHFLYYAISGTRETRGVYVGQIDGSEAHRVLDADAAAVYAASGQLLFVRQGTLFAQQFDPVRLALGGTPIAVAERL